jgi:glycosyltransferase involved in cell wall biosynthesis
MNVALITLEGGGTSTVCYGLARNLTKRKITTTIFTDTPGKRKIETITDSLKIAHLHRVEFPPRFFWFQVQNFQYLLRALDGFAVIHGVSPDASTIVTFYKRKLKKPFVASFHAEPLSVARGFIKTPFSSWAVPNFANDIMKYPLKVCNIKRCAEHADHVVVCSFTALAEFQAAYKNLDLDRVSVIYNAVDLEEVNSVGVDCNLGDKGENLSILFAGRLFWVKGLMYLLKAFEIAARDLRNVRLDIFGKGPEENRSKEFVSNARLSGQVIFHGHIPRKRLLDEIKKSDAVVAPGLYEAQSMLVLEAMACGKPIIAFDIPSMREIIADGKNGILAKSGDCRDLSEKIRLVLSDRKLRIRLGQNAYNYVKEKHNWNKQIEKYLEIYAGLV